MVKHKALVPRLYWPKLEANNEEAREDYYRRLIFLFVPWRNEAELKGTFDNFEERWNIFMKDLKVLSVEAFNDISTIIRNQTMQLEMEKEIFDKRKELKDALRLSKIEEEFEDENYLEVYERIVDIDKHNAAKLQVNKGQEKIFQLVINTIKSREIDKSIEPLRMFCSGTAGTGEL
uniref:Uncharacterized protein n=1 Tax=Panagrolaimus superbus TaxID=310955 RepID=A0A914YCJ2_9BILA